jgi:amino acid adenylation domain-containing protein
MAIQGLRPSPQQKRLWLSQPEGSLFQSHGAILITGPLEPAALQAALQTVVDRHEILRTVFRRTPGITVPIQIIQEHSTPVWQEASLDTASGQPIEAQINQRFQQMEAQPLDMEQGPLLRATLLRESDTRHYLLLSLPSACADFQTLRNLLNEVGAAYAAHRGGTALSDDELVQYFDFSEWQHELLEDEDAKDGVDYWRKQGINASGLTLPFAEGAAKKGFRQASTSFTVAPEMTARLDALVQAHKTTAAVVLLAAWQTLLWRLIGESQIVTNYAFSGRKHEELETGLGLFTTLAPVRSQFSPRLRFSEVIAQLARIVPDVHDWQEYFPWEEKSGSTSKVANFALGFEYQEWPAPVKANGATFSLAQHATCLERFEVKLFCARREQELLVEFLYDAAAIAPEAIQQLCEEFEAVLRHSLDTPEVRIDELDILSEAQRQLLLVGFNQTAAAYPKELCVHQIFEQQAARTPDSVAIIFGEQRLTYAELNARANQLAHYLQRQGVGPDRLVALRCERSPELVIGLLGVLKAGGAYVPLDLLYPHDRLEFMLQDTQAVVLLTQEALADSIEPGSAKLVRLDSDWSEIASERRENPRSAATSENIAYVIYTSGSTGQPKGVMVPHRGLVNYLHWACRDYGAEQGQGAPVHSPIGFDLTITSLYIPLVSGKSVWLLPEDHGIDQLSGALLATEDFSLVKITPAHLEVLSQLLPVEKAAGRARALVIGGEALTGESLTFWVEHAPQTRLINEYGPTETTVGCCIYEVPAGTIPGSNVPIGRPIANTQIYLLDAHMQPVPIGMPGELYIGGDGVARGYHNRPRQTADRFIPDPFSSTPGARMYKTGDLARYLPDHANSGIIEFMGRNDYQVKIRGFRIELGEVEAVLNSHPAVREAVVVAVAQGHVDKRMVAYITTNVSTPVVDELRQYLGQKLPDYMVPSLFVRLDTMPLTPNGKVDRQALPAPDQARPEMQVEYQAPRTPVEEILADLWAEALGIEQVGVNDSFFALGGDSIRSVRVVALAKERGLSFSVQDMFQHQTIAALARHLESTLGLSAEAASDEESDEELLRMLEEIEDLSEADVQAQLKGQTQPLKGGASQ